MHVSKRLRDNDRDVILAAVRNHGLAIRHTDSEEFKKDIEIVAAAVNECSPRWVVKYIPDDIKRHLKKKNKGLSTSITHRENKYMQKMFCSNRTQQKLRRKTRFVTTFP